MVNDIDKLKIISQIDELLNQLGGSIYERELKMLRLKYIYKDISNSELVIDIKYLKEMRDIVYYYWTKKDLQDNDEIY
jgi:hypothetical protein